MIGGSSLLGNLLSNDLKVSNLLKDSWIITNVDQSPNQNAHHNIVIDNYT